MVGHVGTMGTKNNVMIMTPFVSFRDRLGLDPTSHGVSDSVAPMGGPQRSPPKKSRKESFLTLCCYIAFVT